MLTRTAMLNSYDLVREIDVKGHFHPNELRRKLARDLTHSNLNVLEEEGIVQRESVGNATGLAVGHLRAGASQFIRPAGFGEYVDRKAWAAAVISAILGIGGLGGLFYLASRDSGVVALTGILLVVVLVALAAAGKSLFRRRFEFNARIDSEVFLQVEGEMYEDFRASSNIPITSNLTLLVGSVVRPVRVTTGYQDRLIQSGDARITMFQGLYWEREFWKRKVSDLMDQTMRRARDTVEDLKGSFSDVGEVTYRGPVVQPVIVPFDRSPDRTLLDRFAPINPPPAAAAESRGVPPSLRFEVLNRDRFTCRYCGRNPPEVQLEVDHAVAWAQGGDTNVDNLVTACRDCNRGKSAASVESDLTKPDIFSRPFPGRGPEDLPPPPP